MIEKNKIMILCSICTLIFVSGGKGVCRACHMHLCQLRSPRGGRLDGFYFCLSFRRVYFWARKSQEKLDTQIRASPVGSVLVRNTESRVVEHCGDLQDVIHGPQCKVRNGVEQVKLRTQGTLRYKRFPNCCCSSLWAGHETTLSDGTCMTMVCIFPLKVGEWVGSPRCCFCASTCGLAASPSAQDGPRDMPMCQKVKRSWALVEQSFLQVKLYMKVDLHIGWMWAVCWVHRHCCFIFRQTPRRRPRIPRIFCLWVKIEV